ncbi:MAG: flagellar hook-associated protein FlgK [Planctomycetota bacterium]|jgi:flagellar hook-associated protein 1 FlgK
MASSDLSIGLTGLLTAQSALKTIGHNIANVNTPGYSRQTLSLEARTPDITPYGPTGSGVTINEIVRIKDDLLDSQINGFKSLYGSAEVQSDMLQNIESIFNELSEFSLNSMLEKFFESVQNLSLNPGDVSARNQLLQDAQNLATQGFNSLDEQFRNLTVDVSQRIEASVSELNSITGEIASLNKRINEIELGSVGDNANDLLDKRDQLINELSELGDIRVIKNSRNSSVDILLGGTLIVHAGNHETVTTSIVGDGISQIHGLSTANIHDGKLEGLLNMQDVTIPKYMQFIDTLAASFIKEVNNIHSEGVGLGGGFTSLTSTNAVNDANDLLTSTGLPFGPNTGNLYITVTDVSTGGITKNNISIASNETLNTLTAKITGLSNITASNNNGVLTISANSGYTFNFSKELDSSPGNIGSAVTTLSGYYTGNNNDVLTLTVVDPGVSGEIGKDSAKIEVTDSLGTVITTLDVGSSYTPGSPLAIADGVSISFGSGTIVLNDSINFDVVSDPDTSNVLTSLGLNTFFDGNDASTIGVSQYIVNDVSRIAAASSSSPGDNSNALRLINLQDSTLTNNATFSDFLHSSVAQLGIETAAQNNSKESFQTILTNLENRRQEISGVSIEEEMIETMRFQQAFQASARYISVITEANRILMEM